MLADMVVPGSLYWNIAFGRTPGEAVANTWQDEKVRRPGAPMIMNDKMRLAQSSYDAVGKAIGKRPGNVRVIQFRAMAKLREELLRRGYGGEEGDT